MITTRYVPNLFEDKYYTLDTHNLSLSTVLLSFCRKYPEIKQDGGLGLCIRVNGKKISPFQWHKTILKDGDRVLILQQVGVEDILAAFVSWGVMGYATAATVYAAYGAVSGVLSTVLSIATIAYAIYSYVAAPSPNKPKNALDTSPTYAWTGMKLTAQQATPIPVVYGEHKIGGNLCLTTLA